MNITTQVLIKNFIVNSMLVIIKIIGGLLGKSNALVADGLHSCSDAATDLIAIVTALIYGKKRANKEHPYGYGKIEYISSCIVGLVLLLIAYELGSSLFSAKPRVPSIFVIIIILITIIMKLILAHYVYHQGLKYQNNLLKAFGNESKADVAASVVILISVIMSQFSTKYKILKYADLIAVLIVGLFILKTAFSILKDNIKALLGQNEHNNEIIKQIYEIINKKDIDDIRLFRCGPYYHLHITIIRNKKMTLKEVDASNKNLYKKLISIKRIKYLDINTKVKDGGVHARTTRSRNNQKDLTKKSK